MEQSTPVGMLESPLVDFDAICQKVRSAMEPARAHAVSLHDEKGEILWLSESSMGPDEHNAVRDALELFVNVATPPVLAFDLGDARSAILLRAVSSRRAMAGVIMVIMDTRVIRQDDRRALRLLTPGLQRAVADFADMRADVALAASVPSGNAPRGTAIRDNTAGGPGTDGTATRSVAPLELSLADSVRIPRPAVPPASAAARTSGREAPIPALTSTQTATTTGHKKPAPAVTPQIDRLHAALRRSPIALYVQRLVPLTKGGQLKRYEVLLRSKSDDAPNAAPHAMLKAAVENGLGSMIDRRVVTELIGWLVHHPDVWQSQAVMFSVNLTSTALHDEHFIKFVDLCLAKSSLPRSMIGFEVDAPTAVKLGDRAFDIADALQRLGCPLVLDDFGLRTECFDLLRLPAVRYIKLASEITTRMRSDKVSQAAITAVVQMARVLGMHTVAKRTETAAEQEWLTALGVDFIQSNALSPPVALETLSKLQKPAP